MYLLSNYSNYRDNEISRDACICFIVYIVTRKKGHTRCQTKLVATVSSLSLIYEFIALYNLKKA